MSGAARLECAADRTFCFCKFCKRLLHLSLLGLKSIKLERSHHIVHPLCARRARRAAVCEHTHAARGKCAETRTKGTCSGQRAGRGGRFLGSGAPGGSGKRSRGRLAVAAARHALFRVRRGRQRRLCVFLSFTESSLLPVRLPANSQYSFSESSPQLQEEERTVRQGG